jgi:hypothetical protein
MENPVSNTKRPLNRRSFMKSGLLTGGAAAVGAGLLAKATSAHAQKGGYLNRGDAAILRFLAAAELIESDLWIQYAELGGIGNNKPVEVDPNQSMNNYQVALSNLDGDASQYISSNTLDEQSHAAFLNAYLDSRGAEPVNLDEFRTLEGSTATGSSGSKRLTSERRSRKRSSSRMSQPYPETTTISTARPTLTFSGTIISRRSRIPRPFTLDTLSRAAPAFTLP